MVDVNLIHSKPALEIEFRVSLAADLFNMLNLILGSPDIEGIDPWMYATHAALSPEFQADIEAVIILTQKSPIFSHWVNDLPIEHPAHNDFADLVAWLNTFSESDLAAVIQNVIEHIQPCLEQAPKDNAECLRQTWQNKLTEEQLERVVRLASQPGELKTQFISMVTRFWEQFYRREYQKCQPLMERSVAHHRRQNYSADLVTVFTAVTGRRFPEGYDDYKEAARVIFVPSCHIGPYVTFKPVQEPQLVLMVHYNCRPTAAPAGEQAPAVQDLFPPIKALADETRLQILSILNGRELYAQEIVAQLDISQSAVSRHLALMVAGGLLNVRKKESMKYFSIDEKTLAALADRLKGFRGAG